ncbi:MAG: pyridoxal-phosphate dependent enzyme [Colwellia sp.]
MSASFSLLQNVNHPLFTKHKIQVQIKRDDLLHPIISGNKWRKLKYNLIHVKEQAYQGVLTFGGSYSNHIHAFAFACYQQKLPCIGIIRGESQYASNFTLSWATHWGMKCHFVDRKTYKRRFDEDFLAELQLLYPNYFMVPEGGSNHLALPGVGEVIKELNQQTEFDTLLTPVGSGGTLAGLIKEDSNNHKLLGIAVLKEADYLIKNINALLLENTTLKSAKEYNNWQLLTQFHCGGYAKFSHRDANRILAFNQQTGIDFEPVYSGKMILALLDLLDQDYFSTNERIVLLHTGGMQGLGGMIERGLLNAEKWPAPERKANSKNPLKDNE